MIHKSPDGSELKFAGLAQEKAFRWEGLEFQHFVMWNNSTFGNFAQLKPKVKNEKYRITS